MAGKQKPIEERFWAKVNKSGPNDCWNWIGGKDEDGYGRIGVGPIPGKVLKTHRFSYTIHKGEIPDGMLICHKCDNPSCVNPKHLFAGTNLDNRRDAKKKGRQYYPGFLSKLTVDQVKEMRQIRSETGLAYQKIGDRFGVSQTTAMHAIKGVTFKNLPQSYAA